MKMIEILDNQDINCKEWRQLCEDSSLSTFFQTPQCYDFYQSLSFLEAFIFGVKEEGSLKGVVVGYIEKDGGRIKQFFSRRAIITGGPLFSDDISDAALEALLHHIQKELRRKAIYIETRNFHDYSKYKDTFGKCGFSYMEHLNFHVDTSSMEIVQSNLGKSRKRDIRTSLRDGAVVVNHPTLDQVKEYYDLLSNLYETKVKTPLFPMEFFEKLYSMPEGLFLLISLNNEIIGGTVCVCLKGKGVYEWFACGKDGAYKNIYPSTLATYSGIAYAANNGYPVFDMMGAGKPEDGYGVRDFKAKFGGKLVEQGRFLFVTDPVLYAIGKMGVRILKHTK